MRVSRAGAALGAGILSVWLLGGVAGAQEQIFDPENPWMEESREDEVDEADKADDSEEEPQERVERALMERTTWGAEYEVGVLSDAWLRPRGRDAFEFVGGLGLELRHEISEETRIVVSGRFRYWAAAGRADDGPGLDDWRARYEPRLDRAYVLHRPGRWSFSVGQMRNRWGSTDIVAPGDVIDPVDMRDGAGIGEAMSQLSAVAGYSGGDWAVRAVLVPFFQPNRMTLFGSDGALVSESNPLVAEQLPFLLLAERLIGPESYSEAQDFLQSAGRPQPLPKNVSAGARGTWTVGGTDLGLGGFFGWDRTPWVEIDEDMRDLLTLVAEDGQVFDDYDFLGFFGRNPEAFETSQRVAAKAEAGEELLVSEYRRRATFLVDAARYVGPIGVRADVAFSPGRVLYTREFEPRMMPAVFSAVGLSYERLLEGVRPLALTVEGFHFYAFQQADDEAELLLVDGGYYGVAGAVSWHTGLWDLEVEAGGMGSISPGDVVGQASVSRAFRSEVQVTLGGRYFWGPDVEEALTPGGIWAHNDRVFVLVGGVW